MAKPLGEELQNLNTGTGNTSYLCGPLRISAALCVENPFNAEIAEIRRGPQRKAEELPRGLAV